MRASSSATFPSLTNSMWRQSPCGAVGVSRVPCYHPVPAVRFQSLQRLLEAGGPVPLEFPCGTCVGCQQSRQRHWALRITHEAACHKYPSSFVTLTYNENNYYPSLNYNDFKLFMRRVVFAYGPTRYFVAGEYGTEGLRPHWHVILFGLVPTDHSLNSLWPLGFHSIDEVNPRTAAYCAKYTVKSLRAKPKYVVDPTTGECVKLKPEFARMSRRPGIGLQWFDKYWTDVYAARDGIMLPGGDVVRPPRYYDKKLEARYPELMLEKRFARARLSHATAYKRTRYHLDAAEAHARCLHSMKKEKL